MSCLPLLILQILPFLLILPCISVCFLLVLVVQILSQVYLFKKSFFFFSPNSNNLLLEKRKIIPGRGRLLFFSSRLLACAVLKTSLFFLITLW